MPKREIRFGLKPEIRAEGDAPRRILGYAAVFNSPVSFSAKFREVILPGAFRRSLAAGADVRALVEHDPALIIGRNKAGTLQLREDERGLQVEIVPPDTQTGRDVLVSLERGDLDQMSFAGFITGEKEEKQDGVWTRSVTEVDLLDVSVVAFPAYESTSAQARSRAFPDGVPEQIARHMGVEDVPGQLRAEVADLRSQIETLHSEHAAQLEVIARNHAAELDALRLGHTTTAATWEAARQGFLQQIEHSEQRVAGLHQREVDVLSDFILKLDSISQAVRAMRADRNLRLALYQKK